jgi:hypothetical protein
MPKDHVDPEEEYFKKEDAERLAKLKAQGDADAAVRAREDLRALHRQRCGKCGATMTSNVFKGVEIDVCDECLAVLLDPGELEHLVGRDESAALAALGEFFRFAKRP